MVKKVGIGAVCSAPLRYMRPLRVIQTKHPQIVGTPRIEQLLALRKELKRLNKRLQVCIVFRHDDFPNEEIYCHERFCRVEVESPTAQLFGDIEADEDVEVVEEEEPTDELPAEVQPHSVGVDDRFLLRNDGFNVDDDRDPAPENIPVPGETLNDQQTWGWGGRCHRKVFGAADDKPKLIQLTDSESKLMTILSLFHCLFPATYLDEVLLAEINRNLDKEKARRIGLGEFLRFLGLWYYMATFKGVTRAQFWSTKDIDPYSGALIRFHKMMSKQRFDLILKSLRYTNRLAPAYKDKFHGIRQLIEAWNDNMIKKFRPSWVSCLDESMSPWTTRWTCPGWTYVPRKPTPMGNEYHSVCCGVSKIMWQIELVEGKDAPRERVPPANAGAGKTVGLLLRMLSSMHSRGMLVILDSGFCVLQGLIELRKIGIFASAVIKKRRYWPKHVPGGIMDQHMSTKQVGEVDSLKGELDNIPYDLFCMKDADFTMKLMSTYGSPIPLRDAKEKRRRVDGEVKTFKYTETFENHYRYRHAVDDHNNLRHSDISLEETWVTHRWENRAFAFILAITEVNAYLAMRYFVWRCGDKVPMTFLEFRRQLAKALIENEHMRAEEEDTSPRRSKRSNATTIHELLSAPTHARFYDGSKWNLGAKSPYQKYTCKTPGCKKFIRTYCSCSVGCWMCYGCYGNHRSAVATDGNVQ